MHISELRGMGWRGVDALTFGVEIEASAPSEWFEDRGIGIGHYSERSGRTLPDDLLSDGSGRLWGAKEDGSIRANHGHYGAEFVSAPMRGSSGIRSVESMVGALREAGASANPSCGLHVHVGLPEGTVLADVLRICALFSRHQGAFFASCGSRAAHRMGGEWAHPLSAPDPDALRAVVDAAGDATAGRAGDAVYEARSSLLRSGRRSAAERLALPGCFLNRYHALNCVNWASGPARPTVEFRCFPSTTIPARAALWVRMCVATVLRGLTADVQYAQWTPRRFGGTTAEREPYLVHATAYLRAIGWMNGSVWNENRRAGAAPALVGAADALATANGSAPSADRMHEWFAGERIRMVRRLRGQALRADGRPVRPAPEPAESVEDSETMPEGARAPRPVGRAPGRETNARPFVAPLAPSRAEREDRFAAMVRESARIRTRTETARSALGRRIAEASRMLRDVMAGRLVVPGSAAAPVGSAARERFLAFHERNLVEYHVRGAAADEALAVWEWVHGNVEQVAQTVAESCAAVGLARLEWTRARNGTAETDVSVDLSRITAANWAETGWNVANDFSSTGRVYGAIEALISAVERAAE